MAKQLSIISSISEKDDIEVLCSKLQKIGIEPRILYPASDYMSKGPAVCAPVAILWISSKSDEQVFKTANDRNAKGNTTINFFADAVALSDSQKNAVGRNRSVFALVNTNNSVDDLLSLVDLDTLPSSSKPVKNTEASFVRKSDKKESDNVDKQGTSVINKAHVGSITDANNQIQNSEESILSEEANKDSKRVFWMPWIWYVCSLFYYVLIDNNIITGGTDQTLWYLTLTAVFFVFAYKIVRSTITAIKASKWCYLYIPFSLFMVGYDLFYGFRVLSAFFD